MSGSLWSFITYFRISAKKTFCHNETDVPVQNNIHEYILVGRLMFESRYDEQCFASRVGEDATFGKPRLFAEVHAL